MTAFVPPRLRAAFLLFAAVRALAGCATNKAFEDGKQALMAGEQDRALGLFEQAAKQSPDNAEIRATLYRQREVAIARHLAQAEAARIAGNREAAAAALDRVLAMDARNPRAISMRDQLLRGVRHDAMVTEANAMFVRKDVSGAEARVRNVLGQDGSHAGARELLRQIEEARPKQQTPAALGDMFQKTVTLEFRDTSMRNVAGPVPVASEIWIQPTLGEATHFS